MSVIYIEHLEWEALGGISHFVQIIYIGKSPFILFIQFVIKFLAQFRHIQHIHT